MALCPLAARYRTWVSYRQMRKSAALCQWSVMNGGRNLPSPERAEGIGAQSWGTVQEPPAWSAPRRVRRRAAATTGGPVPGPAGVAGMVECAAAPCPNMAPALPAEGGSTRETRRPTSHADYPVHTAPSSTRNASAPDAVDAVGRERRVLWLRACPRLVTAAASLAAHGDAERRRGEPDCEDHPVKTNLDGAVR